MADAPTNGVKAGIEAARGATSSVDGVPPGVLNTARQIALQAGGDPKAVSAFMTQQGYPQHAGEWCGDFAAAVVHASGGTPPPNSAAAGAWADFGSPRQGGPQPGDVAVMRGNDQRTGLPYTHVTFVDSVNPNGTFVGLGGNQGGGLRSTFNTSGFDFRNPDADAAKPSYAFTLPANAPMGMGNNNPLNIKYYKGAEAKYPGVIGPSTNTDQGDPQMKFATPEAGWSAAYSLLNQKYGSGMTTPNQIIAGQGGWTPGNTQAAANVAKSAGIGPNDDIGFSDPAKAQKFMRALVTQEQGGAGSAYPDEMIAAAVSGKAPPTTAAASTAPAPVGTTLTSVGGGDASKLPGFGTAAASKSFTEGLEKLAPGITGGAGGQGGQDQQPQPSPIIPPPPARNVAPPMAPAMEAQLTGYMPKPYGQTLNSFATPLEWGSAPPGASPYAASSAAGPNPLQVQPPPNQQGAGAQQPIGTSLNSLQNMDPALYQQRMAMLYGTSGGQSYG